MPMLNSDHSPIRLEAQVTISHRIFAGLMLGACGTLLAAAVYTEGHRAPDQP